MSKTAVIIDGNSYAYRAFHAIQGLTTKAGQPTGAVFGFGRMLVKIIRERKPEYLAVAFDSKGPTFRHQQYEQYKIDRKPMPNDLFSQFPWIKRFVEALGIPIFAQPGYEADDFLASLARQLEAKGFDVFIMTGDKDLLQLVNDKIKVMSVHKEDLIYDIDKVKERWGVLPNQIVDVLALMGDAVDSIPGVPGVGEKTAISLVASYGSLDQVYKKIDTVGNARAREALKAHRESALMSRSLATVKDDMELHLPDQVSWVIPGDLSSVMEICQSLELKSVGEDIIRLGPLGTPVNSEALVAEPAATTIEEWEKTLKRFTGTRLAVTVDFVDESPLYGGLQSVAASWSPSPLMGEGRGEGGKEVPVISMRIVCNIPRISERALKALAEVWGRSGVRVVGYKTKKLAAYLLFHGQSLPTIIGDVDTAEYLLEDRIHKKSAPPPEQIVSVETALRETLEAKQLMKLYEEIELPVSLVLAGMEAKGIAVDDAMLSRQRHALEERLNKLQEDVCRQAGETFNLNSPQQVGQILFEKMKLPHGKKGKTGYSTAVDVLEQLAKQHDVPKKLLEYRSLFKLKSGYLDALPTLKHPKTNRVHTSYNQTVAATGRLSSSDPNLQNIPIRTEEGKAIRQAFVPGHKGWVLVSADYSQIELRLLAHLSGDAVLIKTFQNNEDIHTRTAVEIFGVKPEELTALHRRRAKAVNFGLIYGMSAFGLSGELDIHPQEAAEYMNLFFKRYPSVREYFDHALTQAKSLGYVTTILGRRRSLPDLNTTQKTRREFAERAAMNAPLQGSAADIIKLAMIQVDQELNKSDLKAALLLQVHDELVLECPASEVDSLSQMVKKAMEGVYGLKVPLKVEVTSGPNWAAAH